MNAVMLLAYFWLNEVQWTAAVAMSGCAQKTVTRFHWLFRRLAARGLSEVDTVIGGRGIIVEIDETKLGRRKFNRGHHVEGVWVLVGVERTEARRIFVVSLPDRSAETIRRVIRMHVAPESVVQTDGWRGYIGIGEACNVVHRTVNHQ